MGLIYIPKGKASEYAEYALNIYSGCSHNCNFCYNRLRARKDFFKNVYPLKKLKLSGLEKEAPEYSGKEILLSFFSDAFQPIEEEYKLTFKVLQIFKKHNIIPNILTKGLIKIDYWDLLRSFKKWKIGVSFSGCPEMENNCVPESQRIFNLNNAKVLGANTWISFEPIINPERIYELISECSAFTDIMRFGVWNYDKRAKGMDWKAIKNNIINICEQIKQKHEFKQNLKSI